MGKKVSQPAISISQEFSVFQSHIQIQLASYIGLCVVRGKMYIHSKDDR